MNKLLIVLLAVCLVSVHAFVKRDAPASPSTEELMAKAQKQFDEWFKDAKETFSKTFDPEQMKKGFNDIVDTVHRTVNPTPAKPAS